MISRGIGITCINEGVERCIQRAWLDLCTSSSRGTLLEGEVLLGALTLSRLVPSLIHFRVRITYVIRARPLIHLVPCSCLSPCNFTSYLLIHNFKDHSLLTSQTSKSGNYYKTFKNISKRFKRNIPSSARATYSIHSLYTSSSAKPCWRRHPRRKHEFHQYFAIIPYPSR